MPPASSPPPLLTGFHEPRASHLAMLEALAEGCLWHEFGDLHLLLP